jgi:meso-butanediol dehydrogenase / (S,S)-butanediol dehydrogenase / diacetyl reductase
VTLRRFEGKTVLITGAAHGIGRAIATRLGAEGARVAVVDIDAAGAEQAAGELAADGIETLALHCDVTQRASVDAALDRTVERFDRLDVLVNNVGLARDVPFEETDEEEWARQVEPTLGGAVRCIQAALPHLERTKGSIVNIGSVNGITAFGNEAYSAAKAGLHNLTENLAMRYARRGIRVNVVAPGTVRTPIWGRRLAENPAIFDEISQHYPLGRVGEPEDVAAAVAFLASADASWITGVVLRVDGGVLAGHTGFLQDVFQSGHET